MGVASAATILLLPNVTNWTEPSRASAPAPADPDANAETESASLRVPPLISRLVTWQRMSFSEPLVWSGISGRSSTISNSALLA